MASRVLLPPGGERLLFVLAHPDDAEFLAAGTVALLVEEGCHVHYLLVTRGEKGDDEGDLTPDEVARIREGEQREAAQILGVEMVTFLDGYFDGEVEPTMQLRREIAHVIRQWKPDVLFTLDPWRRGEIHPDHRAVGICALDALACARGRLYFPEQLTNGISPHNIQQVYLFPTDKPNHWVDISSVLEKKIAASQCHASQIRGFDIVERVKYRAIVAGAEHKLTYAEMFHHLSV
ncbi:LmbE family N-acetylglucosaminyl deacetylase [Thermosporothrix hazakensis]|jgi:LmbE family N-acetylglucosaminyl deacetylase|uniref:LmbE family N-acetylglucosaminyl deacetylase n=1 Tax=Thermosporothrix hazakensis TaxID=644383 RepID=A0A326U5P8_THEHA|nr:PIG-L deacetylase family protein [Thermosporothrix hazakensis]PZW25342.1 LmbE family N-acetylglucosaminyl deacetylase [Thermosporothrix hazakensis]GCE50572.1 GlcNAc-PI de-N-acetylase [Thermosporothrix hazakensis]